LSLSNAFDSSKNLGKLAPVWWQHLQKEMTAKAVTSQVKAVATQAASLIAPAALIAAVAKSGMVDLQPVMRVLVLGRDPMFRLDSGRWLAYAKDFIGDLEHFEALTLINEKPKTSLGDVAEALGLPAATVVTNEDLLSGECGRIDFVLWVHPVNEIHDAENCFQAQAACSLAKRGIPVFASHFNEMDHIAQSVILNGSGWDFCVFKGNGPRPAYVNRFGIALKGTGIRGGWGAMMTKVVPLPPDSPRPPANDIAVVRTALAMLRAEGGGYSKWNLGDVLASAPGGSSRMIGLIGDMALDLTYGRVFHLDAEGDKHIAIGQCWKSLLDARPDILADLIVWSARLYTNYAFEFPPAKNDRAEYEGALRLAIEEGVVEAAIGLARCLEGTRTQDSAAEADRLYRANVRSSPMAAYYVAHTLADSNLQEAANHLKWAGEQGYANAICDLGRLMLDDPQNRALCISLLQDAAALGDVVAMNHVGVMAANEGRHEDAKSAFKPAIELGDKVCADMYLQIVEAQIRQGGENRSKLKREQSWVRERIKKIQKAQESARDRD
jgi:TPR repeat protein